jgi:hypothetical protein
MPGETAVGGNLRTTPVIIKAGESKANVEDTIEPTANGSIVTNNYTLSVTNILFLLNTRWTLISKDVCVV